MMALVKRLALLAGLIVAVPAALSGEPTKPVDGFLRGVEWIQLFDSTSRNDHSQAVGYAQGVFDSLSANGRTKNLCLPRDMSADVLALAIRDWYRTRADWLSDQGSVSMQVAVMTTFACPPKQ